jgi:shikimate kinase
MSDAFENISENLNKPICLIGMMGVGKTTIGKSLAAHFRCAFYDTDQEIRALTGQTIPEIFATHGEAAFRDYEYRVLRDLMRHNFCVIASGGGAVTNPVTAEIIFRNTIPVWLQASPETILRRIGNISTRPLLNTGEDPHLILQRKMKERETLYRQAPHHISTDGKKVAQIVADISSALAPHLIQQKP